MKIGGGIYQADHVGRREVVHGSGIKGQTPEEKMANATLMAAAPEMLEACQALLDAEYLKVPPGVIEKARAAVAKAVGES